MASIAGSLFQLRDKADPATLVAEERRRKRKRGEKKKETCAAIAISRTPRSPLHLIALS